MRTALHWTILAGAVIVTPAAAQTYDSGSPVCLQIWEWGGSTHFDCAYGSWDQCRRAATGLGAMCVDNPYWQQRPSRGRGRLPRR